MIPDLFSDAERTFVEKAVPGLLGRCCFRFLQTANTPQDQKLRGMVHLPEAFVRTRAEWVFSLGKAPFKAFFQGNPWTPQPRPVHVRVSPNGELIDAFILTFQSQKVFLGFVADQETPDPEVLNLGIWYGFPDLARYCLEQGTLPNERSLRAAMDENHDDLFERILPMLQEISDLGQLTHSRHFQRFRARLEAHAGKTGQSGGVAATLLARELANGKIPASFSGDVNALTQNGCTPLESLIGLSYEPALEKSIAWLLSHGADPNIRSQRYRQTTLARSLSFPSGGYTRISALLIKAGAQIEERDKDGNTLLAQAMKEGDAAKIALLLRSKAGVTAINQRGENALVVLLKCWGSHWQRGSDGDDGSFVWIDSKTMTELVQLIIRQGVNPREPDADGITPVGILLRLTEQAGNQNPAIASLIQPVVTLLQKVGGS